MRVIAQRATSAAVLVDGEVVGALPRTGLVLLVGITHDDTEAIAAQIARKIWELRVFAEERSAAQLGAPMLVVSQFTLYASIRKGRRPSWSAAAGGQISEPLVDVFVRCLRELGAHVETGVFGANMQVELVNDGPVTIIVDSAELAASKNTSDREPRPVCSSND